MIATAALALADAYGTANATEWEEKGLITLSIFMAFDLYMVHMVVG